MYGSDYGFDQHEDIDPISTDEMVNTVYGPILEGQGFKKADIPALHLIWMIVGFFISFIAAGMAYSEYGDYFDSDTTTGSLLEMILVGIVAIIVVGSWLRSCRIYARESDIAEFINFNGQTTWKQVRDDGKWVLLYQPNNTDIELILATPKVKKILKSVTVEGGADLVRSGAIKIG